MKEIVAIFLCLLMFSAYDWSPKKKETTVNPSQATLAANKGAAPTQGAMNAQALVTASKMMGKGTPAEREARMASLKRLGEALKKKQQIQTPAKV